MGVKDLISQQSIKHTYTCSSLIRARKNRACEYMANVHVALLFTDWYLRYVLYMGSSPSR